MYHICVYQLKYFYFWSYFRGQKKTLRRIDQVDTIYQQEGLQARKINPKTTLHEESLTI